jgi:hypothetical protein
VVKWNGRGEINRRIYSILKEWIWKAWMNNVFVGDGEDSKKQMFPS